MPGSSIIWPKPGPISCLRQRFRPWKKPLAWPWRCRKPGLAYIISFCHQPPGACFWTAAALPVPSAGSMTCVPRQPLGYMVNCAYPSFSQCPRAAAVRIFAPYRFFKPMLLPWTTINWTTPATRQADDLMDWGRGMVELHRDYGVKMLGGCCGTRSDHLRYLVEHIKSGQVQVASASTLAADHKRGNQ